MKTKCMDGYLTLGMYRSSEMVPGGKGFLLMRGEEDEVFFPEGVTCLKTVRRFIASIKDQYEGYRLLDGSYFLDLSVNDFIKNVCTNTVDGYNAISSLEGTDFARRNNLKFPPLTDVISLEYYPLEEEISGNYKRFLSRLDEIFGVYKALL